MTYGVPYAFVPGTKAKADEVNANFNDVISKIQDTNNLVTGNYNSLDSRCNTLSDTCTTLTNGLASANSAIATKANNSDIDGVWVNKYLNILNGTTWAVGTTTKTYSLSSYLPNDNNIYEVLVEADGSTGSTSGSSISCSVYSSYVSHYNLIYRAVTRTNSLLTAGSCCIIPIARDRNLGLKIVAGQAKTGATYLNVMAYRKVR